MIFGNSSCPWCLERLPKEAGAECPTCGKSLEDHSGAPIRQVDIRGEAVLAALELDHVKVQVTLPPALALIALMTPLMPLVGGPAMVIGAIAHLLVLRIFLLRNALALLGARRRLYNLWLGRLGYLWIGGTGYSLAVVPGLGAMSTWAAAAFMTWGLKSYAAASLVAEGERRAPGSAEKWTLGCLATVTFLVVATLAALAGLLGWGLSELFAAIDG